jgi:hypothetical protein
LCHNEIHKNTKEARRSGWIIDSHKITFGEENEDNIK